MVILLLALLLFPLNFFGMSGPPLFTVHINAAAATGNLAQLKELIQQHGNELDKENAGVALWCALNRSQFECAELLTAHCADIDVCLNENETLLEVFAGNSTSLNGLKWLLEHGADPDFCSKTNPTLLAHFCYYKNPTAITLQKIKLLCEYGANPNAVSNSHHCLYRVLELSDQASTTTFKIIALLIAAGANVNQPISNGNTPLHLSCNLSCTREDMVNTAIFLHSKGAKNGIENSLGALPSNYTDNLDLRRILESDELPPMPPEALEAEKELQKLKIKLA